MMNRIVSYGVRGALVAVAVATSGCFGMDFELPPVTLSLPVANDAVVPDIVKSGDKLAFDLPELCDLPDLAALEQEVRDAAGPLGGLIEIKKVTLDKMHFVASQGNFDFLDTMTLTFTKGDDEAELSGNLTAQTNVTSFDLTPGNDEEVDILGLIPGPNECVQASFDFTGSVPSVETIYDATMEVSIFATLHL